MALSAQLGPDAAADVPDAAADVPDAAADVPDPASAHAAAMLLPAARRLPGTDQEPGTQREPGTDQEPGTQCAQPAPRRSLRADATRNRVAILSAAREVFAEQGLRAPLEEIAKRAQVGIGTLYRRFPTRERLIAAALIEKITQYEAAASQARAEPDPWDGFSGLVRRICELQAGDRGLSDLLSMTLPASDDVEQLRAEAHGHVSALIERAKAAGRLRPDFAAEDLLLVLIANAAVAHVTGSDAPGAWQRFVALILDAFQHTGGDSLPAAPSADQMTQAMARLARDRGCGTPPARIL